MDGDDFADKNLSKTFVLQESVSCLVSSWRWNSDSFIVFWRFLYFSWLFIPDESKEKLTVCYKIPRKFCPLQQRQQLMQIIWNSYLKV